MTKLKKTSAIILPIIFTLFLIEGSLYLSQCINHPTANKLQTHLHYRWPLTSEGWAFRYIKGNPDNKDFSESRTYQFHPTRGWTNKPDQTLWINGYRWTTNHFGHRALNQPNPLAPKPRILVLGDSQTAGDEVDDRFAWPTILQSMLKEQEVINLGVGGYGLTQMAITLDEEFNTWKPDTIVISVISDDLYRSGLSFRSGPMPQVVLNEKQQLMGFEYPAPMTNQDIQKVYFSSTDFLLRHTRMYTLYKAVIDRLITYPRNVQTTEKINRALLQHIKQKYAEQGVRVIFAFMPYPAEVEHPPTALELQFASLCNSIKGENFECVNARDYMQDLATYRQGGGHYYRKGNETTATMIHTLLS